MSALDDFNLKLLSSAGDMHSFQKKKKKAIGLEFIETRFKKVKGRSYFILLAADAEADG